MGRRVHRSGQPQTVAWAQRLTVLRGRGQLSDYTTAPDVYETLGAREVLPQLALPQPNEVPTTPSPVVPPGTESCN